MPLGTVDRLALDEDRAHQHAEGLGMGDAASFRGANQSAARQTRRRRRAIGDPRADVARERYRRYLAAYRAARADASANSQLDPGSDRGCGSYGVIEQPDSVAAAISTWLSEL